MKKLLALLVIAIGCTLPAAATCSYVTQFGNDGTPFGQTVCGEGPATVNYFWISKCVISYDDFMIMAKHDKAADKKQVELLKKCEAGKLAAVPEKAEPHSPAEEQQEVEGPHI